MLKPYIFLCVAASIWDIVYCCHDWLCPSAEHKFWSLYVFSFSSLFALIYDNVAGKWRKCALLALLGVNLVWSWYYSSKACCNTQSFVCFDNVRLFKNVICLPLVSTTCLLSYYDHLVFFLLIFSSESECVVCPINLHVAWVCLLLHFPKCCRVILAKCPLLFIMVKRSPWMKGVLCYMVGWIDVTLMLCFNKNWECFGSDICSFPAYLRVKIILVW